MLLDMEVDLGPGHIVLDGDPPKKGAQPPPIFGTCLLWPNGCMYQDTTWYGGRPQPRRHCVKCGPSPPSPKGTQPNFRPMSVVAKRLDGLRIPLGMDVGLGPGDCVRWGPSSPQKKGTAPHNSWPMSIVVKRLDGSRCHLVQR